MSSINVDAYKPLEDHDYNDKLVLQPWWQLPLHIFALATVWWVSACAVIVTIKDTVSHEKGFYPYPFAFTAITQPCTALIAGFVSLIMEHGSVQTQTQLNWNECLRVVSIGLIQGVEIGLTNKALEYLTVAARTMLNSMSVIFMMGTAFVWGLERLGYFRGMSALLLICGGALQGLDAQDGSKSFRIMGLMMQCVAMVLSAQRWALTQVVVQRSPPSSALGQMSKLQLLARVLPITGFSCLVLAACFEPGAFAFEHFMQGDLHLNVAKVSFCLVGMLGAEYCLVKLVSAVAVNVISAVLQVPIVLVGVVLQHNHVGLESAIGFGFCIAGGLFYLLAHLFERHVFERSCDEEPPVSPQSTRVPSSPSIQATPESVFSAGV